MEYHFLLQESKRILRDYLSVLAEKPVDSWTDVFETIFREEHLLALLSDRGLIDTTVGRLLDMLLLPPGCRSIHAVVKILEAYCRCSSQFQSISVDNKTMFRRFRNALFKSEANSLSPPVDHENIIVEHSYSVVEPFRPPPLDHGTFIATYSQWSPAGSALVEETFRKFALRRTDLLFLRVLVTYGLEARLKIHPNLEETVTKRKIVFLLDTLRNSSYGTPVTVLPGEIQFLHMAMGHFWNYGRMALIVESLYAVCRTRGREECVRFLEVYWDTIPDPLLSEEEVRQFLLMLVGDDSKTDAVDRIVDAFVGLFGRRAYEPRRLAHLCRLTVRAAIVRNAPVTLPAAVELLHLPSSLGSFILCNPERLSQCS